MNRKNPWTIDDEKEHFPSIIEWWSFIGFFETIENKMKWNIKATLGEWYEKPKNIGSTFDLSLFNIVEKKHYEFHCRDGKNKLKSSKEKFEVSFDNSYMKGRYPSYEIKLFDKDHDISFDIKLKAISNPHWVSQDITHGNLPLGIGTYRYGFIPKCLISGSMNVKGKEFSLEKNNIAYFEHIWGDFSFNSPIFNIKGLKKTLSTYVNLISWWLSNHSIKIPNSITFCTDNNPFGYDWFWAVLDNGWTLFYGNAMFWIMDGPATGNLIFSKDGEHFIEFGNVTFKYKKKKMSNKFDFIYPQSLEINAIEDKHHLHFVCEMDHKAREHYNPYSNPKFWIGYSLCESPGRIYGYYFDGERKIEINGICKIESQRQISKLGHNSLKIDFLKPPKGIGTTINLDSSLLNKNICFKLQLVPRPKISLKIKKKF